jgi:hypothetical protein
MSTQINPQDNFTVSFSTRVQIMDGETGDTLLDKSNAVHSQNMARAIARGLSNEPDHTIYRIAFGNGGSFVDAANSRVLNPPNDTGLDARLYNETYSEILYNPLDHNCQEIPLNGRDPGSIGSDGRFRFGGGEDYDPDALNSISSEEVGRKSNILVDAFISTGEPASQLPPTVGSVEGDEIFSFDELGFYTSGGLPAPTRGYVKIDVGNKTTDDVIMGMNPNDTFSMPMTLNGNQLAPAPTVTLPSVGTGPNGAITFGDLCKAINESTEVNGRFVAYITDRSTTDYGFEVQGSNTFGFLIFEERELPQGGSNSTIQLTCDETDSSNLFGFFGCANLVAPLLGVGKNAATGVDGPERLLTHITFDPITKKANRSIRILYTLTVSVAQVGNNSPIITGPTT